MFDRTWSIWGIRIKDKDIVFPNISFHNVNELGTDFAKFIVAQYKKDELLTIKNAANGNLISKIVKVDQQIDYKGIRQINKMNKKGLLVNQESTNCKHWGTFFSLESFNTNFLLYPLEYRIRFDNYLQLSDLTCCAYILNLDKDVLEIYFGFTEHIGEGRYAKSKHPFIESNFYGVRLVKEISIQELVSLDEHNPNNWDLTYFIAPNPRLNFEQD